MVAKYLIKKSYSDENFLIEKTIYNNLTNKYKTLKKQEIELDPVECYKQLEREKWKLWEDNFRELSETKNNHLSKITKTPNK